MPALSLPHRSVSSIRTVGIADESATVSAPPSASPGAAAVTPPSASPGAAAVVPPSGSPAPAAQGPGAKAAASVALGGPSAAARPVGVDATELSSLERWRTALGALARVVADPTRTDQVLVFTLYANAGSMKRRVGRFFDDPRGRRLYDEHRTIDSKTIDLDALAALPVGTLGRAYADFLRSRGLTPEVFDAPPEEVRDPGVSYVVQRMRQTHDLWHVVTGHDTDAASEIALQAFTYAQVGAPSSLILATVGTLRGAREKPGLARDVIAAYRAGKRAERMIVFPWEDHWATPLGEVRALLGVTPATRAAA